MEDSSLYISGVNYESITDADGVATTIFFSGCNHHCDGCHSPSTWDFTAGIKATDEVIDTIAKNILNRPFVKSVVLSGGDPLYSAGAVCDFLDNLSKSILAQSSVKLSLDDFNIWIYTGFTVEQIIKMNNSDMKKLLSRCNVIVDGPFEKDKRDITLNHRGSSNQNIYFIINRLDIDDLIFADYNTTKSWE